MADYPVILSDNLDPSQIKKATYDQPKNASRVIALDALVPEDYDAYDLVYVSSGPGIGEVGLITFKNGGSPIAAVSFTYDSLNRVISTERV